MNLNSVRITAALLAGYASKKSGYDVFKQTVGMTPTEFQHLPQERAWQVIKSATDQQSRFRGC